eukprot:tig00021579_g22433.t1
MKPSRALALPAPPSAGSGGAPKRPAPHPRSARRSPAKKAKVQSGVPDEAYARAIPVAQPAQAAAHAAPKGQPAPKLKAPAVVPVAQPAKVFKKSRRQIKHPKRPKPGVAPKVPKSPAGVPPRPLALALAAAQEATRHIAEATAHLRTHRGGGDRTAVVASLLCLEGETKQLIELAQRLKDHAEDLQRM